MLKIFIINPTYQYVYECIVKIVYHSYEDGNKKFNHHLSLGLSSPCVAGRGSAHISKQKGGIEAY
jgi:hypothetical protein